jgi:hypothetical protein
MNIHCGFTEDRESIVIETTLGGECHSFEWPVTDIPVIVKSIRLAATGEWSFECDPRGYCKGDQIELAERVKVSRRGEVVTVEREHILTFGFHSAFKVAAMLEAVHALLTHPLN